MTPSQPNPTEWEQETTKALNTLAVECAFGVIDREDLPRLVTEALDVIRKATSEAVGELVAIDEKYEGLGKDGGIDTTIYDGNEDPSGTKNGEMLAHLAQFASDTATNEKIIEIRQAIGIKEQT